MKATGVKPTVFIRIMSCLAAVIIAALTACGVQPNPPGNDPGPPAPGSPATDADLVFFRSQPFGLRRNVATILRTEADARAFPGWLGAKAPTGFEQKLTEAARPGRVLVAFAMGVGCTHATGARLVDADGSSGIDFAVRLLEATTYPECFARNDVVAVFSLPTSAAPQDAQVNGHRADPPGPA